MPLTIRTISLTIALALMAPILPAQVVPQFTPFTSDIQIKAADDHPPREMDGKLYVGNGHMRMDMDAQGHQSAIITDFATKTVTILIIEPKMYMEQKVDANAGPGFATNPAHDLKPFDPENPCANQTDITCKKIGEETVSGRPCGHWQITDKNGRVIDVWVDRTLHFPVKTVAEHATVLLTNIVEGQPPASLFEVPRDFHKLDVNSMMGPGRKGPPQN
ncbi:MAG TPA: DUF4412 domain-containing protein [Terriglobales bacterium]|nr:DUF4412 domain-containing protein [Terriglobales bacterium]